MKKIFLYSMMLLTSVVLSSCCDNDNVNSDNLDREFMPMFRCDNNTGKGSDDPYNCHVVSPNNAYLCWYTVDNCVGYEIKYADLAGGEGPERWQEMENKGYVGHVIISDPNQFNTTIKHLEYGGNYGFAIRALHSMSLGADGLPDDPLNSKWYGEGNSRQWADYLNMQMDTRYNTPSIIVATSFLEDKTDPNYTTSFKVYLNRYAKEVATVSSVGEYTADEIKELTSNTVERADGSVCTFFTRQLDSNNEYIWKTDYLEISANASSLTATVPAEYQQETLTFEDGNTIKCYKLTQEDWDRGYVYVKGLDENSMYNINVYDKEIPYKADAPYNGYIKRTKGFVGDPIIIPHVPQATDTISDNVYDISQYNACCLDSWFENHMTSSKIAENQTYYLEGGKNYYISTSTKLYKGFKMETNPADIAAGKGKAKIFMNGIMQASDGKSAETCNFAFGRNKEKGESATVPLEIDTIIFKNIDFSCPLAKNQGDKNLSGATISGNYWFNDIDASAMGYVLNDFEVIDCSFQGFIRGLMRTKTSNKKIFKHFYFYGNEFYNMGFYSQKGDGYGFFSFKGNTADSNPYVNCELINNTFYDSPCFYLFGNDSESQSSWTADAAYNITIKNNTFVNFNTVHNQAVLIGSKGKSGNIPKGSTFTVQNNLFVLAYDENDAGRVATHYACGIAVANIQGLSSDKLHFNISNNWSTSDHLAKTGEIMSNYPFSATASPSVGYWVEAGGSTLNGVDVSTISDPTQKAEAEKALEVQYEKDITSTVLMKDPNPKHFIESSAALSTTAGPLTFHTDNLNGLYYNNSAAVQNSQIYKLGIGASKWREGIGK